MAQQRSTNFHNLTSATQWRESWEASFCHLIIHLSGGSIDLTAASPVEPSTKRLAIAGPCEGFLPSRTLGRINLILCFSVSALQPGASLFLCYLHEVLFCSSMARWRLALLLAPCCGWSCALLACPLDRWLCSRCRPYRTCQT